MKNYESVVNSVTVYTTQYACTQSSYELKYKRSNYAQFSARFMFKAKVKWKIANEKPVKDDYSI